VTPDQQDGKIKMEEDGIEDAIIDIRCVYQGGVWLGDDMTILEPFQCIWSLVCVIAS
jgi:hypothetical protein